MKALSVPVSLVKLVIVLAIFSPFTPCLAQEKHLIDLEPNQFVITDRTFYIDSVVDNRPNKESIGVVQKGMNNRQVAADFTIGFLPALTKYFKVVAGKVHDRQTKLIAVVDDFNISEKTYRMKETGFAYASISFCELDSGKLRKIFHCSEMQESGGMDVTSSHAKRINACLEKCLRQMAVKGFKSKVPAEYVKLEEQWQPYGPETILTTASLKKGIYLNFTELRTNSPSNNSEFVITPKKDFVELRNALTKEKITEPFGFCDGTDIYINTFFYNQTNKKALYSKVIEKGRYFVWMDHYVSSGERAAMFGALGAVGYAAAKSGRDCMSLDLKTGVITPLTKKTLTKILSEDQTLLEQVKGATTISIETQLELIKQFNNKHKD